MQGPLLLACNHPNSFFDALLLGAYFKKPVHFLARGDAFKKSWPRKILTALKAIPVYRLREGKEYLGLNAATFEKCTAILKDGGIVLIFSEGDCKNEWNLRPLKKGTARIALQVWEDENMATTFSILPVSFNYNSFKAFRKNVVIHFGKPVFKEQLTPGLPYAAQITELNSILYKNISEGMLIANGDTETIQFLISNLRFFVRSHQPLIDAMRQKQAVIMQTIATPIFKKMKEDKLYPQSFSTVAADYVLVLLLSIPAFIGFCLNGPLYKTIGPLIKNKTKDTVFYHSALFAVLLLIYPLYVLVMSLALWFIFGSMPLILYIIAFPFAALIYNFWKDAYTRLRNYALLSKRERQQLTRLLKAER